MNEITTIDMNNRSWGTRENAIMRQRLRFNDMGEGTNKLQHFVYPILFSNVQE